MRLPLDLHHDYLSVLWWLMSCRTPSCLLEMCGKARPVQVLLQGGLTVLWTQETIDTEDTGLVNMLAILICMHLGPHKAQRLWSPS